MKLAIVGVAACALALSAHAQKPGATWDGEGQLDNDAFLPIANDAADSLALGDRAFAVLAHKTPIDPASRAWTEVFEAWRGALAASHTGDLVPPRPRERAGDAPWPWPDPDGTASAEAARRGDGVEYAILRRVSALEPAARAAWTSRFAPLASAALAEAFDDAAHARVEREFPATEAAARAATWLCEREFERAHVTAARMWFERAQRHVELAGLTKSALARAIERRRELFAGSASSAPHDEAWTHASNMVPSSAVLIDEIALRANLTTPALLAPGVGVRPGLTFMHDGRAAVHGNLHGLDGNHIVEDERVVLIDLEHGRRTSAFEPRKLEQLAATGWSWATQYRPQFAPGWPLLLASDGDALVLVHGREGSEAGNVLLCVEVPPPEGFDAPSLPHMRWALHDDQRCARDGRIAQLEGLAGLRLEFQPGALIRDGCVFVLAREFAPGDAGAPSVEDLPDSQAEIRTWLIALELSDGAVLWKTDLGKGVEIQLPRGRMSRSFLGTSAAQPLVEIGGRIFAGTHTGLGALVDIADGRVAWTVLNRRRSNLRATWTGAAPPIDAGGHCIVWAPADSDHLYWLRVDPDLDGAGVFVRRPRPVGNGEVLIGGGVRDALVLTREGNERTLSAWNAVTGARATSPYLAPDEWFGGDGLASATRALFATNHGLYLLDRERDVLLVDYTALKLESPVQSTLGLPGGSVWAHDEDVCVLGLTTLWIFRAH